VAQVCRSRFGLSNGYFTLRLPPQWPRIENHRREYERSGQCMPRD
jgi:hypothetical protein